MANLALVSKHWKQLRGGCALRSTCKCHRRTARRLGARRQAQWERYGRYAKLVPTTSWGRIHDSAEWNTHLKVI